MVARRILVTCLFGLTGMLANAQEESPFRFSLSTSASATDNRDSLAAGQEESNVDLRVAPRVDYNYQTDEQSRFDFFYAPGYRFRTDPADNQNETEWHHDLGLSVDHILTRRFRLSLNEQYNVTDDPAISDAGTQIRQSGSFMLNRISASAIYALTDRSTLRFRASNRIKRYDETAASIRSDEDVSEGAASYWYELTDTSAVLAEVGLNSVDYATSLNFDRAYSGVFYGLGYEKSYSDSLSASVRVGLKDINYDDDALADRDDPYGSFGGRYDVSEEFRLFGNFNIGTRESDVFPFASQDYTGLSLKLEKDFSDRITANLGGEWREGEYGDASIPDDLPDGAFNGARSGSETTAIYSGFLQYRINNNYALRLQHRYEDVESDVETTFDRNDTTLVFNMTFE